MRKFSHHAIPKWLLVQTFYNGLMGHLRTIVDAAAGGALMGKSSDEAFDLLEEMAANNYQWPSERVNPKRAASINEMEAISTLAAQVNALTKKLDSMTVHGVHALNSSNGVCEQCGDSHLSSFCPMNAESAQFIGNHNPSQRNNPYSNSYNPGWRNHPNFSWNNQNHQGQSSNSRPMQPPGFQNQSHSTQEKKPSMEEILMQYIAKNEATLQN